MTYNGYKFKLRSLHDDRVAVYVWMDDVDCGSWQAVGVYENKEQAVYRIKIDFMWC